MRKRNLLYIGNRLSKKGSTVTSIETLGGFLKQEGFEVYMASSVKNKVLRLLDMLFTTLIHHRKVSTVLIDTYSTQNFFYAVAVANLCRLLGIAYIPILRGGNLPHRIRKNKKLSNKLFKGARTNITPSMYLYEAFKAEGYTNLTYIPNTVEMSNYPYLLRKEVRPKLLWVRSFAEIYNPLLALQVLEILNEQGYSTSLCMVGPEKDGTQEACKKFAQEKNLDVTFTGMLNKSEWIQLSKQFDIFMNTTNFDNTPVSVIEAMGLGLPVVSTNVGGVPYLIDEGTTGLLTPPNDPHLFAQKIITLLSDSDLAARLSQNARKKAEGFDWQKVKHSWVTLLNH